METLGRNWAAAKLSGTVIGYMNVKSWNLSLVVFVASILAGSASAVARSGAFVHPGLLQTGQELEFMRQKVLSGEEPWKSAWNHLLSKPYSSLDFQAKPVAHIYRGSFGRDSVGDRDLMDSANAAYSQALQWVVTKDPAHVRKALEIIDAWSGTLWDFQGNDAKLLAGWTGHTFCNAAEILRHTGADWDERSVARFKHMLLTVYYPLIKDFFPEANGNWDAAMMDTMLSIGVFCDDPGIFQRAVEHFERGAGNGGITKYAYPNGQCQESTRDQGHTQLGLGELSQACQIAWNQNVDLYGAADNRLALGMEFTARFNEGESVPSYGPISNQGRGRLSDIYEGVWQHYHFDCGMELPAVKRAVEKTRAGSFWSTLTTYRGEWTKAKRPSQSLGSDSIADAAGALDEATAIAPTNAMSVKPGESIQAALDAATAGTWIVLAKGIYQISASLHMPSGVTLAGQGRETVLMFEPSRSGIQSRAVIVNATSDIHDVTLRDFVVDAGSGLSRNPPETTSSNYTSASGLRNATTTLRSSSRDLNEFRRQRSGQEAPNRAGIVFSADREGQIRGLNLENITVLDCANDGVEISGAAHVVIDACDFRGNGGSVPPGAGLEHNLIIDHTDGAAVRDSRLDDSLRGCGLRISSSRNCVVSNDELARNALDGLEATDSQDLEIKDNLAEGNDRYGILIGLGNYGCQNITATGNNCRNNGVAGIRMDGAYSGTLRGNSFADNGAQKVDVSRSRRISY